MRSETRRNTKKIVDTVTSDETFEHAESVVKALHELVPEYPDLHWRHLNESIRDRIASYYKNEQYGEAADAAIKIFCEHLRTITKLHDDGVDLTGKCFGNSPRIKVADVNTLTGKNIQEGQEAMARGLIRGYRNPISHAPLDSIIPKVFTEKDCLDILSLTSYLFSRVDRRVEE